MGMQFGQCGISPTETFYKARGMENPAAIGSPKFMCRYGCLANLTSCRMCTPHTDNSSGAVSEESADSDGLSIWRYLACRYREIENAAGDDLKYAYVFGNGQFVGLGSELEGQISCNQLALASATSAISPFDISNMGCGPGACLLSMVPTSGEIEIP